MCIYGVSYAYIILCTYINYDIHCIYMFVILDYVFYIYFVVFISVSDSVCHFAYLCNIAVCLIKSLYSLTDFCVAVSMIS